MGEDVNRTRKGESAQNLASMRKLALNLSRQEKSVQVSIAAKQKRAGWDHDYPVRCCLAVTPASTAVSRRNTYVQEGRTALQDFWCA